MTPSDLAIRKEIKILLLIGACTFTLRLLLDSQFAKSALLYLAVPFLIAVTMHFTIGYPKSKSLFSRYLVSMRDSTIIMLATSAILFEGFLCVLMFLPIYWIATTTGFILGWIVEKRDQRKGARLSAYALPVIVLFASLEGTQEITTFQRASEVTYTAVVNASIDELKSNLVKPITFAESRPWFLSIFPFPTRVTAGTLKPGDIHDLEFVYRRWFFTNVHKGHMRLRIASVGARDITTEILADDSSYLSTYVRLKGTRLSFARINDNRTRISITIYYDRLLDPAWYFAPLQRLVIQQGAKYVVESVIAREKINE